VVHVGQAVGIDLGHQRHGIRQVGEILQVEEHAGGPRHGHKVQHQVGRAAGGHQADDAVDQARSSGSRPPGGYVVALRGDRQRRVDGLGGQRLAQGRAGVDEAGAGQVQAHDSISIWLVLAVP
jgi:hypothetical protein